MNLTEAKAELENAVAAYAQALHESEDDDPGAIVMGWVMVADITSEALDTDDRYATMRCTPDSQRVIYTRGLLHEALSELDQ